MNRRQSGFTLVELLLAMGFFSFILLFVTTGFILVNRSYNKGITVKLVQDEGRQLIEELSRNIRITDPDSITTQGDCISLGGLRYRWNEHKNGSTPPFKMIREITTDECGINMSGSGEGFEVLNERVGVQWLNIAPAGSNSLSLGLKLSTADNSLLDGSDCSIGSGDQFCDVVEFSTVVSARALGN